MKRSTEDDLSVLAALGACAVGLALATGKLAVILLAGGWTVAMFAVYGLGHLLGCGYKRVVEWRRGRNAATRYLVARALINTEDWRLPKKLNNIDKYPK